MSYDKGPCETLRISVFPAFHHTEKIFSGGVGKIGYSIVFMMKAKLSYM